ncbi:MAG: GTPase Era, partial [Bacteroidales bacterium]|nr:GTPase Era [Bacteroidales bacterium]
HESMMKFIETALIDADIILLVTEVNDKIKDIEILKKIEKLNIPILVLINKIDLSDQQTIEEQIKLWKSRLKKADVIPISALEKFNIKKVFDKIIEKLPENPPFFPKDELTDKSQRFFVSEIIREKILLNYSKEIPYSIEVVVDEFKEDKNLIRIKAYIYVARDSQKAIIIGHKGNAIKKFGTEARIDIEDFIEKKVYLELSVKVNKDWRNKESQLKRFGYIN